MTHAEAIAEAKCLLKDQANLLACLSTDAGFKELPHQAKVAIQREITRLRLIAEKISSALAEAKSSNPVAGASEEQAQGKE